MKTLGFDCVFFESCNLNCKHCFQNHTNNIINENYIKSLPDLIIPTMFEEIEKKQSNNVIFSMRGGELFQDKFSDELFNIYTDMILEVQHRFKEKYPDIPLTTHFMSNAIYHKIDRVVDLIKKVNGCITLSYDVFGRYTSKEQEDLFFKNFEIFKQEKLLRNIGVTLTKQSIDRYISDIDILKKFNGVDIDINYYIPTSKEAELVSDDDLYNFFKCLLDNKIFNCVYIKNILDNFVDGKHIYPSCNCANTTVFFDGKIYRTCNIYVPDLKLEDFYGKEYKNVNENNGVSIITKLGFQKRNCFLCKYFNNCSYYCWMMLNYKKYNLNECPHKKVNEYIEKNKSLLGEYIKWRM